MDAYVDLFARASEQQVKLNHWELQKAETNLTVAPAGQAVQVAGRTTVTASWTTLTTGTRYLGQLHYSDGADGSEATILRVDS